MGRYARKEDCDSFFSLFFGQAPADRTVGVHERPRGRGTCQQAVLMIEQSGREARRIHGAMTRALAPRAGRSCSKRQDHLYQPVTGVTVRRSYIRARPHAARLARAADSAGPVPTGTNDFLFLSRWASRPTGGRDHRKAGVCPARGAGDRRIG